ncbi:unnamed protein product [Linum tenue]|uniref:non-specific serine/threonine protein kinase n=1 Tax=Linum tenue TaxID=586396 RepID=A0AAV0IYQ9_9ROSI|nr:unnamed protein product [Linum tenue]
MTQPAGEGLAFVLTADPNLPANSTAQIVAVEFDTRKSYPEDLDDNHAGLNLQSVYSVEQVSLSGIGVNLSSETDVTVRIEYDGTNLTVFLGTIRIISRSIDLSVYLPEKVHVGFSGSTSQLTQLNCIRSWEFISSKIGDGDSNMLWVWIVSPILALVLTLCSTAGFLLWRRRRMQLLDDPNPTIEEAIQGSSTAPRKFKLKELKIATGNFNPRNKLGKGGFGTVYKGILEGKEVAVKKVSKKSTQGKQEFISEVTTIGNLRHRNLVKLIGWAYERREYLLVYEYMPNGSLDRWVSSNGPSSGLTWATRIGIIVGSAHALDYLHNGCEKRILHRDIKASNIMLNLDYDAKLGDFGLARTIRQSDQTHHSTKEVAGTPGYMAPEIFLTGRATVETDVYGFGVLMLEVACGRRPGGGVMCPDDDDYSSNIVKKVWELYRMGDLLNAADSGMNGDFHEEEMARVLILGLTCCHPNPNKRPSMKLVLKVLTGESEAPELPLERPAFVWPPLPPSFKDKDYSLVGSQLTAFTELSGR